MKILSRALEQSAIYRLWQAPFADAKLHPVKRHNNLRSVRSILDVGCGPGTNARQFAGSNYLGIDINPRYVAYARRRYGARFEVADAPSFEAPPGTYDFILVNSLLHHLPEEPARRLLRHLAAMLASDGHIHILELVLPDRASIARVLARADRGDYPGTRVRWVGLFQDYFEPVVVEPYALTLLRIPLWHMLYFKGKPRR